VTCRLSHLVAYRLTHLVTCRLSHMEAYRLTLLVTHMIMLTHLITVHCPGYFVWFIFIFLNDCRTESRKQILDWYLNTLIDNIFNKFSKQKIILLRIKSYANGQKPSQNLMWNKYRKKLLSDVIRHPTAGEKN
jgi:hypothetical protein